MLWYTGLACVFNIKKDLNASTAVLYCSRPSVNVNSTPPLLQSLVLCFLLVFVSGPGTRLGIFCRAFFFDRRIL